MLAYEGKLYMGTKTGLVFKRDAPILVLSVFM